MNSENLLLNCSIKVKINELPQNYYSNESSIGQLEFPSLKLQKFTNRKLKFLINLSNQELRITSTEIQIKNSAKEEIQNISNINEEQIIDLFVKYQSIIDFINKDSQKLIGNKIEYNSLLKDKEQYPKQISPEKYNSYENIENFFQEIQNKTKNIQVKIQNIDKESKNETFITNGMIQLPSMKLFHFIDKKLKIYLNLSQYSLSIGNDSIIFSNKITELIRITSIDDQFYNNIFDQFEQISFMNKNDQINDGIMIKRKQYNSITNYWELTPLQRIDYKKQMDIEQNCHDQHQQRKQFSENEEETYTNNLNIELNLNFSV